MPLVHPEILNTLYVADISSNGIVAFMVALLNYRAFVKHFIASKAIEAKNAVLVQKNEEIKRINKQLQLHSEQDELTQLFNRRKINQQLQHLARKFLETGENFSIILLDIDHFKKVNDNYGHSTGDRVLKAISQTLRAHVRDVDSCGRWGGEEFIVVCPASDSTDTAPLAERLRQLISSPDGEYLAVTASFGVACFSRNSSLTQLLHTADACLYAAKNRGRNRVVTDSDANQLEMFPLLLPEV
jgi:diguanylate cyclase (GGDEF)-like protein